VTSTVQTEQPLGQACSFGARLSALAAAQPDAIALVCDEADGQHRLSRGELDQRANRLARAYAAQGLRAGDVATLALTNGVDFFLACFAIWKLGATPNPVSPRLPRLERDAIIERAGPRFVIGVDPGECGYPCLPGDLDARPYSDAPHAERVPPRERALASGGSTGLSPPSRASS